MTPSWNFDLIVVTPSGFGGNWAVARLNSIAVREHENTCIMLIIVLTGIKNLWAKKAEWKQNDINASRNETTFSYGIMLLIDCIMTMRSRAGAAIMCLFT